MDWDITHSWLFTGAGTPWAAEEQRPLWYNELSASLSNIDWDPRHSETFREVILPTLEATGVAAATILVPGVGGALLAGGLTLGWELGEKAAGIEQHTFYAQFAPVLGALAGAGYMAWQAGAGATTTKAGLTAGAEAAKTSFTQVAPYVTPSLAVNVPKPASPASTYPGSQAPAAQYGYGGATVTQTTNQKDGILAAVIVGAALLAFS